jgi:preprotein translocase subunit YajC
MVFALLTLLAEGGDGAGQQASPNPLGMILPFMLIAVAFYFLMMRPMRKQEQQRQSLISNLKKNDKVVTSGGIIGVVAAIKEKEDEVTLKVDESSNVRLRVLKSSITRVLTEEPAKDAKEGSA